MIFPGTETLIFCCTFVRSCNCLSWLLRAHTSVQRPKAGVFHYGCWLKGMYMRIRHSWGMFFRKYDPKYSLYCRQYFANILPILRKHQITKYPDGCIIALQIENEMFEMLKILPIGLMDDMRYLCKAARDFGMTVPFFTNDGFEEGSFNANKSKFGVDLYGFDKYVIFMPASSISSAIFGSDGHSGINGVQRHLQILLMVLRKEFVHLEVVQPFHQFLYQSCRAVGLTIIP